jgi:periplasmic divalent cation tolerance protein
MKAKIYIGLTTCNDKQNALHLIKVLLNKDLIACGQVEGPIVSRYIWEDGTQEAQEWRVVLKFKIGNEERVFKALKNEHQYETPQWVFWSVCSSDEFFQWVNNPTGI